MSRLEKTLVRQAWYRRPNLYPGQIWYREAGTSAGWMADDAVIVIMNSDLMPNGKIAPAIRVTVEWGEPTNEPLSPMG